MACLEWVVGIMKPIGLFGVAIVYCGQPYTHWPSFVKRKVIMDRYFMVDVLVKKSKVGPLEGLVYLAVTEYNQSGSVTAANYTIKVAGDKTDRVIELFCDVFDHDFDATNLEFIDCVLFPDNSGQARLDRFLTEFNGSFSEWERQNYDADAAPAVALGIVP